MPFTLTSQDVIEATGTGVVTGGLVFAMDQNDASKALMVGGIAIVACWLSKMITPKFFS